MTRLVFSSLCLSTAWSIASRNLSRVTVSVCIKTMSKSLVFFKLHRVEKKNQVLTFTKSAWARNGNFLSALPLKPMLFLKKKRKEKKNFSLWLFHFWLTLDCYERSTETVIWLLLHYRRLYSQSNFPQVQTVFRHLTLCKAHRLELKHGKQLLPRVDDLALHIAHIVKHRDKLNFISSFQSFIFKGKKATFLLSFTYLTVKCVSNWCFVPLNIF